VTPQKPKLRIREIVFAVAMGGVAAGGAALVLSEMGDEPAIHVTVGEDADADRTYELADFDEVSTTGPQNLIITYGEEFSVRSEGSERSLDQLEAVVENGTLRIRPRPGGFRGNWDRLEGATFYVTMPKLETIEMAGSGQVSIDQIKGERFSGTVNGPGELEIGALEVDDADLVVNGGGEISVSGTARTTKASIGGAGEIDGRKLSSENATVSIGGVGDVALDVSDEARVSLMGAGDVEISGTASCTVSRMGIGDVDCESDNVTDDTNVNVRINRTEVVRD